METIALITMPQAGLGGNVKSPGNVDVDLILFVVIG